MIYVHKVGSINAVEGDELDVKGAWKAVSPAMIRRTDRYIQLALLGANEAIKGVDLAEGTALYMASGQGNLAVFKRLRDQRYIRKQPPKPVDFINSLSNTSGFYVAQFFGVTGKNLNVSRLGFVAETTLLLAQNDLQLGREKQILIGGVDELQEPAAFTRKTLGLCDDRLLGEGSNWMLLSSEKRGAIAELDAVTVEMDLDRVKRLVLDVQDSFSIAFGQRVTEAVKIDVMQSVSQKVNQFTVSSGFYETASLYLLNSFIQDGKGRLLYIETYNDRFRVIQMNRI